jgi:chorismate dehydratase
MLLPRSAASPRALTVGCVSYLNAKPLIDGFDPLLGDTARLALDVPSRLLGDLVDGRVDLALCPVIDYFRSPSPLLVVPVGGICCDGPTLTVRLFSRVPVARIAEVHADTDSHTSVALLRVLLANLYDMRPPFVDYRPAPDAAARGPAAFDSAPETMLLIGDKVVTASPPAVLYPHQLDLGEAWKRLTGLPFVFATWLARAETPLGDLPDRLARLREHNAARVQDIVDRHAAAHGWPPLLAREYLGRVLRYEVGQRELEAIRRFARLSAELGVIAEAQPVRLYERGGGP